MVVHVPEPVIRLDGVSKSYDEGRVVALRALSLVVDKGEFVAVSGPSGSGKSTLLNVMSGLDRPTSGRALFEGEQPRTRRRWASIRARRIGYVYQRFNLLATLTAVQNVEIPMFGVVASARDRRRRACDLLHRVGLDPRVTHYPHQLSVGERQRVAIARSLVNAPAVILADEPTGNLDSRSASSVIELLQKVHEEDGTTLVIVTHDAAVAAHARRLVRLEDGAIVADGRT